MKKAIRISFTVVWFLLAIEAISAEFAILYFAYIVALVASEYYK